MNDERFDRDYQVARAELNAGIASLGRRLIDEVAVALDALHRIHFSAPWTNPHSR